jgi:hypothetical protein
MFRFTLPLLALAGGTIALAIPLAHADSDKDLTGAGYITRQDVNTRLTGQGYVVAKVESDDGAYKAKAMKDGHKVKLTVDPKTGAITSTKTDD